MRTLTHCRKLIPFELDFYICLNGSHITCDGITIFDSPIELKPASSEYLTYGTDYAFYSCESAKEKDKTYVCVITFDRDYTSQ